MVVTFFEGEQLDDVSLDFAARLVVVAQVHGLVLKALHLLLILTVRTRAGEP